MIAKKNGVAFRGFDLFQHKTFFKEAILLSVELPEKPARVKLFFAQNASEYILPRRVP